MRRYRKEPLPKEPADMSLSNKLTLEKVDVKGKRVVMRWGSGSELTRLVGNGIIWRELAHCRFDVRNRLYMWQKILLVSSFRGWCEDAEVKVYGVRTSWAHWAEDRKWTWRSSRFPSMLRVREKMLYGCNRPSDLFKCSNQYTHGRLWIINLREFTGRECIPFRLIRL